MTTASIALRDLVGLGQTAPVLSDSALIMIDFQNTYRKGVMQLTGVEEAIKEAQKLLKIARDIKIPIIHIQHDAGPGTPYDVKAEIGTISDEVTPVAGESLITRGDGRGVMSPRALRASFTSSSLKWRMMASIFFIVFSSS